MICPKCGNRIPARDKYCGYCGASTGFLPIRLLKRLPRRLILISAIVIIAIATLILVSWATHEDWFIDNASSIEDDPAHQAGIILYSHYAASKPPDIDGVLSRGEWPEPAISMNVCLSRYKNYGPSILDQQRGKASFYCINDNDCLYMAITLSSPNPDIVSFDREGVKLGGEIVFDGDNDGYPTPGDDIKRIGSYYLDDSYTMPTFSDEHVDSKGWPDYDQQQDGEGAEGYAEDTGTWVCECRVPLNPGDPQDLALQPGDTIGVRWEIDGEGRKVRWYEIWDLITRGPDWYLGDITVRWPDQYEWPPPCRSLVLASGL